MLTTAAALASSPPPLPGFLNALASPLQHYGIWVIGLLILLEDFGVPAPGETVLIAGAIYAGAGRLNVVAVGVVGFVAAVIGDNIGFAIGHFGGRALALRWGRYVFLTEERLNKAELFFHRHGGKVIVIARFVEGLRQANGIMAGIAGMHWRRFLAFNALGAALWVGTWVSLGYFAGQHIATIYHYITVYSYYALIAAIVETLVKPQGLRRVSRAAARTHLPGTRPENIRPPGTSTESRRRATTLRRGTPGMITPRTRRSSRSRPASFPSAACRTQKTVLGSSGSGGSAGHLPHVPSRPPCPGVR